MTIRSLLALALLVTWTSSSCVFSRVAVNQPVDSEVVARFQPGRTTAREVVESLGAPTEVVQLGYRSAYRYDRTVTKDTGLFLVLFALRGSDARQDRIWLFFNEEEVLTHVGTTFAADRTRYKLPWSRLHKPTSE